MNTIEEQINQLTRIYNTMLEISTKGEDTMVMADCLRALEQVIVNIKKNLNSQQKNQTFQSIENSTAEE